MTNEVGSGRMKITRQRGVKLPSCSSTGSFCPLEGSKEEACPTKTGELCFRRQCWKKNPFQFFFFCPGFHKQMAGNQILVFISTVMNDFNAFLCHRKKAELTQQNVAWRHEKSLVRERVRNRKEAVRGSPSSWAVHMNLVHESRTEAASSQQHLRHQLVLGAGELAKLLSFNDKQILQNVYCTEAG